jgi:hypothetical protein
LQDAVAGADVEQMARIIDDIHPTHPQIAQALQALVAAFRFDVLHDLLIKD